MKNKPFYFVASVMEERLSEIDLIAKRLENLGCVIDKVHPFSGIISGSTDAETPLEKLKIDGIKYIEPDRGISI